MHAKEEEKPLLKHLNEHIVCPICTGYLIDATTLAECLHSFCRGCIVRRLSSGVRTCPVCSVSVHSSLLPDTKLQRLVYLTVPGLFRSELEKRRHFRLVNPQCSNLTPVVGAPDLTFDDLVSLSLSEYTNEEDEPKEKNNTVFNDVNRNVETDEAKSKVRYLKCPAGVTVRHILRLLMLKRGWDDSDDTSVSSKIEVLGEASDSKSLQILNPSWTLLDLACIFKWKRDAPMKLFYRIVGKDELKKSPLYNILDSDTTQVIEDSQRPPTPPPSPKPNPCLKMPLKPNQSNLNSDHKEPDAKKPRCEVTPVLRSPEAETKNLVKDKNKTEHHKQEHHKTEHHKKKKHRNKRIIAEITTTPREDLLKLKVRLTPCPARSQSGSQKEKSRTERGKEKVQEQVSKWPDSPIFDDESDDETIQQIIDSIPDEVVQMAQDIKKTEKEGSKEKSKEEEDKPKDAEVLRQLGLVNTQEIDREKLEKQLQESKANRVRSLLAEKQMRDTLESIKIMTNKVKEPQKKKGPPPLTPLKTVKKASETSNRETPLDLSNGVKNVLDLSPNPSSKSSFPLGGRIVKNAGTFKEERGKSIESNLRTLSEAAVSLIGGPGEKKVEAPVNTNKVALKIPQPHQRISGFGMKMKPNLGIRHIPNPQAIVASQFRNQRPGYLGASSRQ